MRKSVARTTDASPSRGKYAVGRASRTDSSDGSVDVDARRDSVDPKDTSFPSLASFASEGTGHNRVLSPTSTAPRGPATKARPIVKPLPRPLALREVCAQQRPEASSTSAHPVPNPLYRPSIDASSSATTFSRHSGLGPYCLGLRRHLPPLPPTPGRHGFAQTPALEASTGSGRSQGSGDRTDGSRTPSQVLRKLPSLRPSIDHSRGSVTELIDSARSLTPHMSFVLNEGILQRLRVTNENQPDACVDFVRFLKQGLMDVSVVGDPLCSTRRGDAALHSPNRRPSSASSDGTGTTAAAVTSDRYLSPRSFRQHVAGVPVSGQCVLSVPRSPSRREEREESHRAPCTPLTTLLQTREHNGGVLDNPLDASTSVALIPGASASMTSVADLTVARTTSGVAFLAGRGTSPLLGSIDSIGDVSEAEVSATEDPPLGFWNSATSAKGSLTSVPPHATLMGSIGSSTVPAADARTVAVA